MPESKLEGGKPGMWRYFRVGSAIGAAGSRQVDVRVQALGGGAAAAGWQRNRLHSSVATNASLKAGRNSGFRQRPASSWVRCGLRRVSSG